MPMHWGAAAVQAVNQQQSGLMVGIKRTQQSPYRWCVDTFQLDDIANKEYALPKHFIREDQLGVTQAFIDYLSPLIQGETAPRFKSRSTRLFSTIKHQTNSRRTCIIHPLGACC